MNNISPDVLANIKSAICRPEGTVVFNYICSDIFNKNIKARKIIEIPSGEHLFLLERDEEFFINFYHSSPGTGTRVASINLVDIEETDNLFFAFVWSPNEIRFHLRPIVKGQNTKLVSVIGIPSPKTFRVGKDGIVYQLGDQFVQVRGVSVFREGKPVLLPTALETWKETIESIKLLSTGKSSEGYIYESVVSNLSIAILVTGFEAYSKKRFLELEKEGIIPNIEGVIKSFFPKRERDIGIYETLKLEAEDAKKSLLIYIVDKGVINFQNIDSCKRAFNKCYGIKFGEIGLSNNCLPTLKKIIAYRHKIIHVSPSIGMLNQEKIPPEEPVFPTKALVENAIDNFNEFIDILHKSTLELRP
ncbi:hypothetical protein IBE10_07860 [Francisella tularensis subsp. novicida]|uniref:hypothetical protein n=1 Tax=Francisella tularensis TaxID=263 RepID=UPI0008FD596B|nr:hypothetical protein [Francisella tularensis]APC94372.1 hypothetical protein KX02_1219 [Francisella tularensis subsp. novicida]MBK2346831.1 hypothetical protein [Francisella tularensis subsp. novicida]